jgi:hypothetical protein
MQHSAERIKLFNERFGEKKAKEILENYYALIFNFGSAAKKFTASGFATTPPAILAARESTCRACPEWDATALNGTGRCRKCGCSTWAKLRMATERCPLGKWEAVSPSVLSVSSVVNPPEVLTGAPE